MTETALPDYYNDLVAILHHIEEVLAEGAADRNVAAHHPIVANLDEDGGPSQRVMILRESDWRAQRLRFHTDIRSTKIAQLETRKQMSVLIYDEAAKLQLRLSGTAWVEASAEADTAWQMSTPFARRCYMADVAPGTVVDTPTSGLPSWIEGRKPDEAQLIHARDNFAVLYFSFDHIDWLYLANAGHRRARFLFDHKSKIWSGIWLSP